MSGGLLRQADAAQPMLCIGHSHVGCVARAAERLHTPLLAMNFWDMPGAIERSGDMPVFSTGLAHQLAGHAGAVYSMIGGAAHGVLGMLVHPRRFDFVWPAQPELPLEPLAEVLPAALVRRLLESLMSEYLALMDQLRQLCPGPMFHLEPPPPFADAARMYADIPWGMYPGMRQEISPAWFRYKLWRLHSQILQEWCMHAGAVFVACPVATIDEHGFMREAFYGDGAHANEAYGEQVLEQMRLRA